MPNRDPVAPALVIGSVLESDARATAASMAAVPAACGLIEIRADRLELPEIAALVRGAARPVVTTIRSTARADLADCLLAALAAGSRYVDVDWDGPLRSWARGERAAAVVLSHHGSPCTLEALLPLYRAMAESRAAVLKIVPSARSVGEIDAVRRLLEIARAEGRVLACFAEGRPGALSRLLAPAWGSWATYGAARAGAASAAGQFPAATMLDVHDVLAIRSGTRRFAIVGRSVFGSPSPAMHRAGHARAHIDARYFPIELDAFEECLPLVGAEGIARLCGVAVTMPFKEAAASHCRDLDRVARLSGAVNTVLAADSGLIGSNTDGPAALSAIARHLDPAGRAVAIVGAGGTARAVGAVLREAGARVTLFNRSEARGREAARRLGVQALPLGDLPGQRWDVLVQATPLGSHGEEVPYGRDLCGRLVLDVVYGPGPTPLVARARASGLAVIDGLELLVAQAVLQFEAMTGAPADPAILRDAAERWLAAAPPPSRP